MEPLTFSPAYSLCLADSRYSINLYWGLIKLKGKDPSSLIISEFWELLLIISIQSNSTHPEIFVRGLQCARLCCKHYQDSKINVFLASRIYWVEELRHTKGGGESIICYYNINEEQARSECKEWILCSWGWVLEVPPNRSNWGTGGIGSGRWRMGRKGCPGRENIFISSLEVGKGGFCIPGIDRETDDCFSQLHIQLWHT